jgi:hypothetical protein
MRGRASMFGGGAALRGALLVRQGQVGQVVSRLLMAMMGARRWTLTTIDPFTTIINRAGPLYASSPPNLYTSYFLFITNVRSLGGLGSCACAVSLFARTVRC